MSDSTEFRTDCRHWVGYRPCVPQKGGQTPGCRECPLHDRLADNFLIIEAGGFGSIIRTTTISRELKRHHPGALIQWLTHDRGVDLLAHVPSVDRKHAVSADSIEELRGQRFSAVFNYESRQPYLSLAATLHSRDRGGFVGNEWGLAAPGGSQSTELQRLQVDDAFRRRINKKSMQQIFLEAANLTWEGQRYDLETTAEDEDWAVAFLLAHGVAHGDRVVGINVGSSQRNSAKRWPVPNFIEFLRAASGKYPTWKVLLLAGPEDREPYARIQEACSQQRLAVTGSGCDNTFGKFMALVKRTSCLVSADTFGLHVGIAFDRPVVCVSGPQPKQEIWPYGGGEMVSLDLGCSPCFAAQADRCTNPVLLECMRELGPESILDAVGRAINGI